MKRLLIIPLATLFIGFSTSSCSSSSADKARSDSIAAAELEAARLDSIRQDSINRRNFSTPDLAFNDLHGDVKRCEFNSDYYFTYDEKGKWTNEPQWEDFDKQICPDRTKHPRVIRNKDGYITRIYWECDADYEYEDISWEGGKVKTRFNSTYSYDNDGLAISREDIREYDSGTDGAIYCNYVLDDMGNWIKRDVIYKLYSIGINDDEKIEYSKSTETRDITYYKSNNGGSAQRHNNTIQEKALQNLREFAQQKEQDEKKGPEWINGTWAYKGHVTTRLGTMYVNIALDINRSKQTLVCVDGRDVVESGKYKVYNGAIHCNSSYFDLDEINHRIDFGDGVYLHKK